MKSEESILPTATIDHTTVGVIASFHVGSLERKNVKLKRKEEKKIRKFAKVHEFQF